MNLLFNNLYDYIETLVEPNDRVRLVFFHDSLDFPVDCDYVKFENLSISTFANKIKKGDIFRKAMTKIDSKLLERKTKKLAKKLHILNKVCDLKDISNIEMFLRDYKIVVYDERTKDFIRRGTSRRNKTIYLLLNKNNHFATIVNIKAFLNATYFCEECLVKYGSIGKHKCPEICKMCKRDSKKCQPINIQMCSDCNNIVNNEECLNRHQKTFCWNTHKFKDCGYFKSHNHLCKNQKWCSNCKEGVCVFSHRCYVFTEEEKNKKKKKLQESKHKGYIFFDYEATQENIIHKPNLICALKICLDCTNQTKLNNIKNLQNIPLYDNYNGHDDDQCECERREFISNEDFCNWLFKQKNYVAIAHNLKGYDGVFVMNFIQNNFFPKDPKPSVIAHGSKILSIYWKGVKLIESYSFIPNAFANFPKCFGFSDFKKGFFPHFFNTDSNQNFIGSYPDKKFYGYEACHLQKKSNLTNLRKKIFNKKKVLTFFKK